MIAPGAGLRPSLETAPRDPAMRFAAALVLAALLGPLLPSARAQNIQVFEDDYIMQFDEQNGEKLEDFINLAQKLLNRPIRYDPGDVSNTIIRIIGPQKIKQVRFFQYFQAVLKAYDFLIGGKYFEPTGKVSRSKLNKLLDALKSLGDIPQDFAVETLFLPGVTQTAN